MLVAMFASPRRMRWGSGCLTSESEERETWTAEFLRAAFRAGASLRGMRPGRDFGGRRFRSTLGRLSELSGKREFGGSDRGDLVERCDEPEKGRVKLERLMLGHSEHCRQA